MHRPLCSTCLLAVVLLAAGTGAARAAPLLELSIDHPSQSARAGQTLDVSGTVTNRSGADLSATDLFLNFSGFDFATVTPSQQLGAVDFSLPDFTFRSGVDLFTVDIAPTALAGLQTLQVVLQDTAGNLSPSYSFVVDIEPAVGTVPEPPTLLLMVAGLAWLIRRARHRPAAPSPFSPSA